MLEIKEPGWLRMKRKINTDYNDELENFRLDFQRCASGDL